MGEHKRKFNSSRSLWGCCRRRQKFYTSGVLLSKFLFCPWSGTLFALTSLFFLWKRNWSLLLGLLFWFIIFLCYLRVDLRGCWWFLNIFVDFGARCSPIDRVWFNELQNGGRVTLGRVSIFSVSAPFRFLKVAFYDFRQFQFLFAESKFVKKWLNLNTPQLLPHSPTIRTARVEPSRECQAANWPPWSSVKPMTILLFWSSWIADMERRLVR